MLVKEKTIKLKRDGYNPFLDYVKAYAIICVLVEHTLPHLDKVCGCVWVDMQVPLFVLLQAFHVFSGGGKNFSLRKIFLRVFFPYLCVQSLLFLPLALPNSTEIPEERISSWFNHGGFGPGSYYPWIYLQMALLLPVLYTMMKKAKHSTILASFLIFSEIAEIVISLIDLPDTIYRLLAIRYVFLVYLAWLWAKKGIVINKFTIILSALSIIAVFYFEYFSVNDEPWFYNTTWKYHRWPCYYYLSSVGGAFLHKVYEVTSKRKAIDSVVKHIAKCSYEIFLMQMIVIYSYEVYIVPLNLIADMKIQYALFVLLTWFISLFGGMLFNSCYNRYVYNRLITKN